MSFWRLTNQQAPEAQYEIETAHIPDSASRHSDFISAPDMQPLTEQPLVLSGEPEPGRRRRKTTSWQNILTQLGLK